MMRSILNNYPVFFLLVAFFLLVCDCSDEYSSSSEVNGSDAGASSSSSEIASSAVEDAFVEYVEPPTLTCEPVEGILVDSVLVSYAFSSFGFYGDNIVAIPTGSSAHGDYIDNSKYYEYKLSPVYIYEAEGNIWKKISAFPAIDGYFFNSQVESKLCIVDNHIAFVRHPDNFSFAFLNPNKYELCRSDDALNWQCDSLADEVKLTCDDKYFYKGEVKSGRIFYSDDASTWIPIDIRFADGLHSLYFAFSNDTAHFVAVTRGWDWYTLFLYSKDMITWDTSYVMRNVAHSIARLGEVYVMEAEGWIYYSKDLKEWNIVNQENGDYTSNGGLFQTAMAVSKGVLVVVGDYGYVLASKNGKDFKVQERCNPGGESDQASVIVDSQGNFYALHNIYLGNGKYDILRVVE